MELSSFPPISEFDGAAFLREFQVEARKSAACSAKGQPVDFFPEDAACSVCAAYSEPSSSPLYSHSAWVQLCCGQAVCRKCMTKGRAKPSCPFCSVAFPRSFEEAQRLLHSQAAQPTGGAWAKYELATGSWPGAAGGSAQPFSEGATRRKFLKEAARDGLASAQVTLALEEHLTGPCRTAPSPKDMKAAQSLLVSAAAKGHPMGLFYVAVFVVMHAQPLPDDPVSDEKKDGASAIAGIASTSTKHPPSPPNNGWFTALLCNRLRTLASFGPSLDLGVAAPLQDRVFELLRVSAARLAPPALALLLALSADHAAYENSRRQPVDDEALAAAAGKKLSVEDDTPPPAGSENGAKEVTTAAAATTEEEEEENEAATLREMLAAMPPEARAALTERRFKPTGAQEAPAALAAALRNAHALANPVSKTHKGGSAAAMAAGGAGDGGRASKAASTTTGACAACGTSGASLYCSQCRTTAYCCKGCQKAHWKAGHKAACAVAGAVKDATVVAPKANPTF